MILAGDDEPLMVVDIGSCKTVGIGTTPTKILGALGVKRSDKDDVITWVIISIDRSDPLADQLNGAFAPKPSRFMRFLISCFDTGF